MSNPAVHETDAGPVLELSRLIPAEPREVFAAWADPTIVSQWFGPEGTQARQIDIDFRPGGAYRFEVESDEGTYIVSGEYLEIDRPNRLRFSWQWASEGSVPMTVEVTFKEAADGATELGLRQTGFNTVESAGHHQHGWSGSFDRLVKCLVG